MEYSDFGSRVNQLREILPKAYNENSHHVLDKIGELLKPVKLNNGYGRISASGEFELDDYGLGLLYVSVVVEMQHDKRACCRVSIDCVDDGNWQARSKIGKVSEAERTTDEISKLLFFSNQSDLTNNYTQPAPISVGLCTLPTSAVLNNILHKWNMHGSFDSQ